ncbi:Transferase domain containing protein [Pyrenophora tritici-repentis]|uniref:Transferase domain containing protein n=3 Tax=Pyrenophora tritici-repentis TaxID=45151 RepID=A0A2W1GRG5_9PLEO|nr:Transferase domain-containing protein [Pyrenophora tritici-repentis]KAF7443393.1 Transferase domain containing protein [Pyrenophora tritici-repentis]KAF7568114.1 Transferase domain containing protein [Pyrenophora tritici-repentis]KAG9376923.1 Transferase domain containing protein [Pyrenophora tritici-repentis]KAI0575563.1 Transferase domain-containing protein [Pyrenophora tritici-repentis]
MPKSGQKELELSFIDQQPHIRVYGRYYVIFPFPGRKIENAAINALRTGFKEVLRRYPYLAGTVDMPDASSGQLRVLYPDPINNIDKEAERVFTASNYSAKDPTFDYNKLQKDSFLPEDLPAKVFCPKLVKYHPGLDDGDPFAEHATSMRKGPLPVFATQASFIPKGLVLSVWFYHAVTDGNGNARILEVWSNAVRSLRNAGRTGLSTMAIRPRKTLEDPSSARRKLVDRACDPGPPTLQQVKRHPLRQNTDYKVITKMFRFSSAEVNDLREALCTYLSGSNKPNVSRFATLTAIIWAYIIRARLPLLKASKNTQSALAIVVDLRKHLGSSCSSPEYLGNLVISSIATWKLPHTKTVAHADDTVPLQELISGLEVGQKIKSPTIPTSVPHNDHLKSLASFASQISTTTRAVNKKWATTELSQVLHHPSTAQQASLEYSNGPDLYITSWMHMGADRKWDIPGADSSQATAIRRSAWVSEGGITVLPRKKDGEGGEGVPYEVMISLAEADMEAFEEGVEEDGWLELGKGDEMGVEDGGLPPMDGCDNSPWMPRSTL